MGEFSEERSDCVQEIRGREIDPAVICVKIIPIHYDDKQTQNDELD